MDKNEEERMDKNEFEKFETFYSGALYSLSQVKELIDNNDYAEAYNCAADAYDDCMRLAQTLERFADFE